MNLVAARLFEMACDFEEMNVSGSVDHRGSMLMLAHCWEVHRDWPGLESTLWLYSRCDLKKMIVYAARWYRKDREAFYSFVNSCPSPSVQSTLGEIVTFVVAREERKILRKEMALGKDCLSSHGKARRRL